MIDLIAAFHWTVHNKIEEWDYFTEFSPLANEINKRLCALWIVYSKTSTQ